MGLTWFLSILPADYCLIDQIIAVVDKDQGSTATTLTELSETEKVEAILKYFFVNSGYVLEKYDFKPVK